METELKITSKKRDDGTLEVEARHPDTKKKVRFTLRPRDIPDKTVEQQIKATAWALYLTKYNRVSA